MQLSCTKFAQFIYEIAVCIDRKTSYLSNAEDPINLNPLLLACQPVLVNLFTAADLGRTVTATSDLGHCTLVHTGTDGERNGFFVF